MRKPNEHQHDEGQDDKDRRGCKGPGMEGRSEPVLGILEEFGSEERRRNTTDENP